MNIKVVIVWSAFIVIFAGLGLLGYFNRDLFKEEPIEEPKTEETSYIYTCKATLNLGESIYRFSIKDNVIEKVSITYNAAGEDINAYAAASNINEKITNEEVNGLSSIMYGSITDFSLMLTLNPNEYDKVKVDEMNDELSKVSMVIDSINKKELYVQAISTIGNKYECE